MKGLSPGTRVKLELSARYETSKPEPVTQKTRRNYMKRADAAFGKGVRSVGYCESDRPDHKGNLQCAHIISRSYKAIRTDPDNALCLCQGCHMFYTNHVLEWEDWIDTTFPGRRTELRVKALAYEKVDWKKQAVYWEGLLVNP